jgi:hypothetical protein
VAGLAGAGEEQHGFLVLVLIQCVYYESLFIFALQQ